MNTELLKNRAIEIDLAARELADDHDISYGQAVALLSLAQRQLADSQLYELHASAAGTLREIVEALTEIEGWLSVGFAHRA